MTNASIKFCFLILNSAIFTQNCQDIYSEPGVQNQTPNSNTTPSPEICCLSLSEKGQSAGSIFYTDISCMALNYNLPYPKKTQKLKNTEMGVGFHPTLSLNYYSSRSSEVVQCVLNLKQVSDF